MRAQDALPAAVARLAAAGVADPPRDARKLLAFAMGLTADRLTLHLQDALTGDASARFEAALAARSLRQPVAQIIGTRDFYGRSFQVTRDVLDPRPDTETLVAAALGEPFARVLDLGTGSGAILISLLAEAPQARGLGVDISPAALQIARANAERLGVALRAQFALSDWFSAVTGRFDLIVANPPYIADAEIGGLDPEVRDWEPRAALCPGGDGLAPYRVIAGRVAGHLEPGGRLLVEIGAGQGPAVAALWQGAGLRDIVVLPDLDGRDRVVLGRSA